MTRTAVVIGGPFNGQIIPLAGIKAQFPFVDHRGYFNVTVPWTVLGQDRFAAFWEDGEVSKGWGDADMIIVGVDPGVTGAIAVFLDGRLGSIVDMPINASRADGAEIAYQLMAVGKPDVVYLEWTQPMPKNGSIASFSLGLNTGIVIGVVQALGIPLERVRPSAWKLAMGLRGKNKAASRGMATELWPDFAASFRRVKDDGRAEAALIARYGAYQNIRAAAANAFPDYERDIRGEGDVPFKGLRELSNTMTGVDEDGEGEVVDMSDLWGSRSRHPAANGITGAGASQGVES